MFICFLFAIYSFLTSAMIIVILWTQTKLSVPRSATTSPSYSVERCPTFSFSRSEGSLTTDRGQGQSQLQGHSDVDDVNANIVHQHQQQPGVNRIPCESEGIFNFLNLTVLDFFVTTVAWWRNGTVSDLWSGGRGFDSRSGRYQVIAILVWVTVCGQVNHPGV